MPADHLGKAADLSTIDRWFGLRRSATPRRSALGLLGASAAFLEGKVRRRSRLGYYRDPSLADRLGLF
jgi:hypothetical protein